jgi:F-type H+-transporting ATPase subunit b
VGFSWTTFAVEIINFAILVWLLTRLLYRPVMKVIADRKAAMDKLIADANTKEAEAEKLRSLYDARLAQWEAEKKALREKFEAELSAIRSQKIEELQAELQQERVRNENAELTQQREAALQLRKTAYSDATAFCSQLLSRIASPEVEARLIDAAIADLSALPAEQRELINRALASQSSVLVKTRYPVAEEQRARLKAALLDSASQTVTLSFAVNEGLIGGIQMDLGTISLDADIADELRFFAVNADHGE